MNKNLMFSSKSNEWGTPKKLYDKLDEEFGFTLDPCATITNAKCKKYYTIEDDGLTKDWSKDIVFCNPPYGRVIREWVRKASEESKRGATVVMLIPARTDTKYFHNYIYKKHEIRFIKGRIKFENDGYMKNSAPFPSMIVIMKGKNNE